MTTANEQQGQDRRQDHLNTEPNLSDADDFYAALIDMHRDLTAAQSQLANAKLILLLSNQIGDLGVLREAMDLARRGVAEPACGKNINEEPS